MKRVPKACWDQRVHTCPPSRQRTHAKARVMQQAHDENSHCSPLMFSTAPHACALGQLDTPHNYVIYAHPVAQ